MSTGRALLGFVGVATIVTAHGLVAVSASRRWFGDATAPLRHLVQLTLGLASALAVGLALGSVGAFRPVPLVVGSVAAGVLAAVLGRRSLRDRPAHTPADGGHRRADVAVAVAIGVVAVRWIAEVVQTVERGFSHADELHYHLTHAALFAQSGRTWPIRFTSVGDGAAYHPAHSELLHGIGLSVVGSDFLSIFLNLVFVATALAAAWVIGERCGARHAATLVVAAVLALRLVTSEGGSTLNDTMAMAMLLTAVALLVQGASGVGASRPTVVVAGIAAGLAVGTKLTVLVAIAALVLVVAVRPAGQRLRSITAFVGAALVAGGYWYARNLAATGNPVPALSFGPLPGPDLALQRAVEFPVIDYLGDPAIWREHFVPGLAQFFGPLWPVPLALAALCAVSAVRRPARQADLRWCALAVCGVLSLLGYAITPTSAAGRAGEPVLFSFNLRYALPGLLLCGLAGLSHPGVRRHPDRAAALAGVVFVAANLHGIDLRRAALALSVVGAAGLVAVALLRLPRRATVPAVAALLVVAVGAGIVLDDRYLDRRWSQDLARWSAYEAGDAASGVRVGITGFPQSYPFFGAGLDNTVVTIGDDRPGDELVPFESCPAWWDAVEAADLDVVVVLSERALARSDLGRLLITGPDRWLRAAGATPVLAGPDAVVFDVRSATGACTA